jgi:hypothetical protein
MNIRPLKPARAVFAGSALSLAMLGAHAAAAPGLSMAAAPADIHDIRGPKPIPSPWLAPLIAATVLLAAGGGYAAWVWNRRRLLEPGSQPLDIALARLDQVRQLMDPPRGREFSIEVSGAVRDYIESRFGLRAAHLTTDEFLHQLLEPTESSLSAHRVSLDNFLQTCDLAKFGGWNLDAADMEAMLQSARQFIVASAAETSSKPAQPAASAAVNQSRSATSRETYVSLPSA